MPNEFALDITKIRDDAREKMAQGAVTKDNTSDVDAVIDVLNQVVATEIVCWMRYTQHAIVASGINRAQVAAEFTDHATEERQHTNARRSASASSGAPRTCPPKGCPNHTPTTS